MAWERYVLLGLAGCVAAFFVETLATNLPARIHTIRSPKASAQCAGIRAGWARSDVMNLLADAYPPSEQFETSSEIGFSREDGTCVVRFDYDQKVVRADFSKPTIVGYPN